MIAVAGALAVTGATSSTGAPGPGGPRAATRGSAASATFVVAHPRHGDPRYGGPRRWDTRHGDPRRWDIRLWDRGHPAEVTAAQQAHALRYWTAARMAEAKPPGPSADPAVAQASVMTPPVRAAMRAARTQARPDAAAVLMSTATAAWPGGGAVAAATGKVFFTMDGRTTSAPAPSSRARTRML